MRFLVDTSALVRIWRKQVDPGWYGLVDRGLLMLCEPVLAETLLVANTKRYADMEDDFRRTYLWAAIPDNIWEWVGAVRRELVPHSARRGLSVADLVVAATAIRLKLEVLHD